MDDLNWKILNCLQQNARESFVRIGKKVGLTSPAVADRVRKMESDGLIRGYAPQLNFGKMGYQLHAIITLGAFAGKLKPFLSKVKSFDEVINCYRITGNENIIMEVVFKDQAQLEKFIDTLINYGETRTHIILSSVVSNAAINKPSPS